MGLIALVLVVLIVAAVGAVLRLLRRQVADVAAPRTVADLVRLRAQQAAPEPAVADDHRTAEEAGAEPPVPGTVVGPPAVAQPVAAVPETAEPVPTPAAAVQPPAPTGSDTPWGRAARMTDGDGTLWASGDPDHEWSGWADWADVDDSGADVPDQPEPAFRPVILPAVNPGLFGPRTVPAAPPTRSDASAQPVTGETPARPVLALVVDEAPAVAAEPAAPVVEPEPDIDPIAPTEEDALRRRTPAEIAAEQAAADVALLRTFGSAPGPSDLGDDDEDDAPMSPAVAPVAPAPIEGAAQLVAFRVVGRDGDGIEGAGVTLLDDQGRETTAAEADAKGRGEVHAPHPGSYVLVSAAPGHQPGAVAITVADGPVEAEVLLARSASVAGTVSGEDGPIVGARLTLVQDGEIVDTTGTGPTGEYWFADLAAGDYGLSVAAAECEQVAVLLTVPDETDLRRDVELVPAGLPAGPAADSDDDVMIGQH